MLSRSLAAASLFVFAVVAERVTESVVFANLVPALLPHKQGTPENATAEYVCFKYGTGPGRNLTHHVRKPLRFSDYTNVTIEGDEMYVGYFLSNLTSLEVEGGSFCNDSVLFPGQDLINPQQTIELDQVDDQSSSGILDDTVIHISLTATSGIAMTMSKRLPPPNTPRQYEGVIVDQFLQAAYGWSCTLSISRGFNQPFVPVESENAGTPTFFSLGDEYQRSFQSCEQTQGLPEVFMFNCTSFFAPDENIIVTKNKFLGCEGEYHPYFVVGNANDQQNYPLQILDVPSRCRDNRNVCKVLTLAPTITHSPTASPTPPTVSSPTFFPSISPTTPDKLPAPEPKQSSATQEQKAEAGAIGAIVALGAAMTVAGLIYFFCNEKIRDVFCPCCSDGSSTRSSIQHHRDEAESEIALDVPGSEAKK